MKTFLEFIRNDVLVAHHAAFDIGIINKTLNARLGKKLLNKSVDTAHLAGRIEKGLNFNPNEIDSELSLDKLCIRYNIQLEERHTAAGDALATAILFVKLIQLLKQRGVDKLKDI